MAFLKSDVTLINYEKWCDSNGKELWLKLKVKQKWVNLKIFEFIAKREQYKIELQFFRKKFKISTHKALI